MLRQYKIYLFEKIFNFCRVESRKISVIICETFLQIYAKSKRSLFKKSIDILRPIKCIFNHEKKLACREKLSIYHLNLKGTSKN